MFALLKLEFKNCLSRRELKFIFSILMLFSIGAFLLACFSYYGKGLTFIRSAYEMTLLQGASTHTLLSIECMLIPLFASVIYSDSYYSDLQSGVYKSIVTRAKFSNFLWAKAIVAFVVTFFAYFLPLLVNQLLCLIAFPVKGFESRFGFPFYDLAIQNYGAEFMFDLLRLQSPLLYNLLYMLLISLVAGLFALFSYGLYFVLNKGRFVNIAGVFVLYMVVEIAVISLFSFEHSLGNLLKPHSIGSFSYLLTWMVVLFVAGMMMIGGRAIRPDVGIEK